MSSEVLKGRVKRNKESARASCSTYLEERTTSEIFTVAECFPSQTSNKEQNVMEIHKRRFASASRSKA